MARKPYQVKREQLTDEEWEHLDKGLFPLLKEMKLKARQRMKQAQDPNDES